VDRSSCELRWSFADEIPGSRQKAFQVEVKRHRDDVIYIEAESLLDHASSKAGWREGTHIHDYRGDGFLCANRQSPALQGILSLKKGGEYLCWVRYHPQPDGTTKLTLGNSPLTIRSGGREQWEWARLGSAELGPGENRISISHSGKGDTVIDVIVLTTDPAFDPRMGSPWAPAFDTGEVNSPDTFLPPPRFSTLEPGLYQARVRAANGKGVWGIRSASVKFNLRNGPRQ
jgi:hypothetical protein